MAVLMLLLEKTSLISIIVAILLASSILALRPFLVWMWKTYRYLRDTSSFPEPPRGHWFTGHTKFASGDLAEIQFMQNLYKFGKTIRLITSMEPIVVAVHPDSAKVILAKEDAKDARFWQMMKAWLGEGLLSSKGEKWRRNRKLLTHAFHFGILKGYVPLFQQCLEKHLAKWKKYIEMSGPSIDVFDGMKIATLNCLISCAFGEDTLNTREKEIFQKCTERVLPMLTERQASMLYAYDWLYYCTPAGRKFKKNISILHDLNKLVLNKTREARLLNVASKNKLLTFVDVLIDAKDENGNCLSDKEILDEINTFMFAGHDTTGSAIPYCLYYLAKHNECQSKCREEIMTIMGDRDDITWEDLSKMSYLTMCIKETLRMAGPVFTVIRSLEQERVLPDGKVIPKGCQAAVYLEPIHHNPENWKDPVVYDPERFSPENAHNRHPHAFLAFSAGPRVCIGQNFAMAEMKVLLCLTLKQFHMSLDDTKPLVMSAPFLRHAENGLWIKMQRIQK